MNFDPGLIEWTTEHAGVDNILRMIGEYPGGIRAFTYHYPNPDAGVIEHCRERVIYDIRIKWNAQAVQEHFFHEEPTDPEYDRYDQEE